MAAIDGITLDPDEVETNIVIFEVDDAGRLVSALEREGVRMGVVGARRVRAVTHLDVDAEGVTTCRAGCPTSAGEGMKLEGIHHITAITGDAPGNVDFYVRVLGLRLVKKSVNQDDPTVYHLFYADEQGSAGSDLTFFEYPNARQGRAGAGMVHRIAHRVASADTLDFWADRLGSEGVATARVDGELRFADPEGLSHELVVVDVPDAAAHAPAPRRSRRSTRCWAFAAVDAAVANSRRTRRCCRRARLHGARR